MNKRTGSIVAVVSFIVLVFVLWFGSGMAWRMLLAMHGHH